MGVYLSISLVLMILFPFQDNFLPVIDLFQRDSVKLDVCKSIMSEYRAKVEASTSDPVLINNLLFLCRILNDSVK